MRTVTRMAVLPAALLAMAACGRGAKRTAASDTDLKKDLQLASSSIDLATTKPSNIVLSPVEEAPLTKPEQTHSLKKAAGPKAIRSPHPTVKASPVAEVAAEAPKPQVEQPAEAPSPQPEAPPEPALPPATRPSPGPTPSQDPGTGRAQGDNGTGSVIGAVLGGILGAVIRGGGVDGDRCEPHGGRRGRGGVYRGPDDGGMGRGRGGVYGGGGVYGPGSWPPINPMTSPRATATVRR